MAQGDIDEAKLSRDKMENMNRRMSPRNISSHSSFSTDEPTKLNINEITITNTTTASNTMTTSSSSKSKSPQDNNPSNTTMTPSMAYLPSGLTITRSGKQYLLNNGENVEIAK